MSPGLKHFMVTLTRKGFCIGNVTWVKVLTKTCWYRLVKQTELSLAVSKDWVILL